MKSQLHLSAKKVYTANDKMAEKLSRIIGEKATIERAKTKSIIEDIKKSLTAIARAKAKPDIQLSLEEKPKINLPLERQVTYERTELADYKVKPSLADDVLTIDAGVGKLFEQVRIDKELLRKRIRKQLADRSQITLSEVIINTGGIEKGLAEIFAYFSVLKEFKIFSNEEIQEEICFDKASQKSIITPQIIISK